MLLLSILIFVSIALMGLAGYVYWTPTRTELRLRELSTTGEESSWTETALKVAGPLARLSLPEGRWEDSPLRMRFLNAGLRGEHMRVYYFAAKTSLSVLLAGLSFMVCQTTGTATELHLLLYVSSAALVGMYLPNVLLHIVRKNRQREIFESFPDATDLMLVCMEAGLGLDAALVKVTDEMGRKSPALAEELHLTNLEMRAGGTREKALRNLALRTGVEEIETFASMLMQADRFGTSIGDSLRVYSEELRHKRQVLAEERAAKVPTKLLLPLVLLIFPSVLMVILGPAIIRIIRTMLPLLQQ
jgi:tight adherence protein C